MLLAAIPLVAYFWVLARHTAFAVGGPDSSGYMNEARMFAAGQLKAPVTPLRTMKLPISFTHCFTPLGFLTAPKGRMVPSYPPGLPLHFAVAGKLGGWNRAPYLVVPLLATLSLILMYGIARELRLSRVWSLVASALLASIPIFLSSAIQPLSDDAALFWALVAMYCALRANRRAALAIVAGIAFGIGVWVRPTNLLLALPFAFALRWRWPLLWRAAVGAIPVGLALAAYQKVQFGSPFLTGYGSAGEMLQASIIAKCAPHHLLWLMKTMSPLAILGLLFAIVDRRLERRTRILLPIWIGIFFLFYMAYDICADWWDMRFLLPGVPALIIGPLLVLQRLATTRVRSFVAAALALVLLVTPIVMSRRLRVFDYGKGELQWPRFVSWTERQLPPNALVIGGIFCGAFYYYSDRFVVRWDQLETDDFQLMRAYAGNANLRWYAMMSSVADTSEEEFVKRYPGKWTVVARERDVTLWRLDE
jgi:dolichyl-phosphate-mannose-protein mannosyltransferase